MNYPRLINDQYAIQPPAKAGGFVDHWEENEPNGALVKHDRERFSHELTLVFEDGRTQILTHAKESSDP